MKKKSHTAPKLRLKTGLSAIFFGIAVFLTDSELALPCLLSAAFHECGHILAARLLGIRLNEMKLDLFGARLSVSSKEISYRAEFLLCAAGPLFSLLLSLFFSFLGSGTYVFLQNIRDSSLFLGLLNLLPVRGFDGGRMLSSLISLLGSPFSADLFERLFTGIFLIILWGIAVYLLLVTSGGLTLFVFSAGLFCKVFLL